MTALAARDFDVVIVGAGIVGAVMAALLVSRRLCAPGRVAVIADRFAPPMSADADWDLRVFAINRASEQLLKLCGVWSTLPPGRVLPYERMCIWDAGGEPEGTGALRFDCADIGEPNLGSIVDGAVLQSQCLQAARSSGAVLIEAELDSAAIGEGYARLGLSDGRAVSGKLLIAADGIESKSRRLLQIASAGHSYDQDALVAHVRTTNPHRNTAWQRFLPTGPLAFLPLRDGRSSVVWSVVRPEGARLRALDSAGFAAALTEASSGVLGACELTTRVASFPLKLQYADHYVQSRAVLLGDAAHAVHPLAGQGLNFGLLDCAVLAEVLESAGVPAGFGDMRVLRRYERRRRGENFLAAAALDGLERLFSNTGPAVTRIRALGLNVLGNSSAAKTVLARRALGLSGDVPAYLKEGRA